MNHSVEHLLSIVIATKNRQKYALKAVESILSINDDRIEVVIQDNSDVNSLEQDLAPFRTGHRLIYRYTNEVFSFIDNFNASVELARGEYLCLIGDDDGINPEIIAVTLWAKSNNVDALVGALSANYRWEGTGAPDTFFTKMTGSTLTITDFNGKAKFVDIQDSLEKLMQNGCTNYLDFLLPKLYHGVVKRACLEKIKEDTGEYIKGLSPDIYSSIALACVIKNLVYLDYPITIPGVCAESGSIKEGQIKKHSKKLEDAPHFKGRTNYFWNKEIPRIFCVQTIWADSGFAALREMRRNDLLEKFNRFMLYANIINADKSIKHMVMEHIEKLNENKKSRILSDKISLYIAYVKGPLKKFIIKRALGRIKIMLKISKYKDLRNLDTIVDAMHALTAYLQKVNINIIGELKNIAKIK